MISRDGQGRHQAPRQAAVQAHHQEEAQAPKGASKAKAEVKAKVKADDIAVGHTVHIEGLVVAVDMNGRTGVVQGRYHDRWLVRVDGKDCNFPAKNLRLERVDLDSD